MLLGCFLLCGCSDWLDVKPYDKISDDELFSTEEGFQKLLNGVYVELNNDKLYGCALTVEMIEIMGGAYTIGTDNSVWGNYKDLADYQYETEYWRGRLSETWNEAYAMILNCNEILENMESRTSLFTGDNYNIIRGEALALRAMLHFDMLRLFGPVYSRNKDKLSIPYYTAQTNLPEEQLPASEVIRKVITDLEEARILLVNDPVKTEGTMMSGDVNQNSNFLRYRALRMNYYAVTALLARVYLWGNDKEAALKEAKEIIGEAGGESPASYELANSAATTSDPMFNKELIFTLDVQKLKDNSDIYFTESFSSTSNILTMSSKGKTNIFNGSGLDNEFRNYWITPYSDGSSFVLKKYTGVNYIPMFKISELYLIAAECAQGKAAYDYLNKLRNHRGLSSIAPTDDLAGYIFQEYRREFIGEGQMFFYYKRKAMETIGAENNIAHQDVNAVYNLPIPTVEIDFGNIKN